MPAFLSSLFPLADNKQKIHICDDWISCEIANLDNIPAYCDNLRASEYWLEVVGGLTSLAVQFDPKLIDPSQAAVILKQQVERPPEKQSDSQEVIRIPACYDPAFAPDSHRVADLIGLSTAAIADWHNQLQFTVTMLGFMPGFAYLQCDEDIPEIGRLSQPRQTVPAGSIGIIGDQSCIYSFDSPGGWPIIGRTPASLFDPQNDPAALLSAGQKLEFFAITSNEFAKLA